MRTTQPETASCLCNVFEMYIVLMHPMYKHVRTAANDTPARDVVIIKTDMYTAECTAYNIRIMSINQCANESLG